MNSSNLSYYKNISIWEGLDKFSPNKNERIIQIDLGRKSFENNFNKFNEFCELPCQCPVCRALKYTYVFRYLNGGVLRNSLFYYHNCLETEKYVSMLDRFAKNLTWKEYTEMVKRLQDTDDSARQRKVAGAHVSHNQAETILSVRQSPTRGTALSHSP